MTGYARVTCNGTCMWVRFERVGRGTRFDALLDVFRMAFPIATWDEFHKAWQLPTVQFSRLKQFCEAYLGSNGIQVQSEDTTKLVVGQLALW